MNNSLFLGTSKIDITPTAPLPLAGYATRKGTYLGIRKNLYIRCWLFSQHAGDGGENRSLLVQADLIWWGTDRIEAIKARIRREHGLESVILHATHTHSGPQTSDLFVPSLGAYDEAYVLMLEERLLQGIEAAKNDLEPVVIEKGVGRCSIGIHRRKRVNGQILMMPNDSEEVDPDVHVVRFAKQGGDVKGVLFHYSCHPTTTKDNFVSSEFPGVAMEAVEAKYGSSCVASYLQGCCGDTRPALVQAGEFYDGTAQDVERLGLTLGEEVLRVLNLPMVRLVPNLQKQRRQTMALPFASVPDWEAIEAAGRGEDAQAEWSRLLLEHPSRLKPNAELELSLLHIAEGLSFLALNCEPVLKYGLTIKRLSGGSVLPLGYSDGMIGYVATASQLAEGGYEAFDSHYYFGLPGPFAPETEKLIMERIESLLSESVSV